MQLPFPVSFSACTRAQTPLAVAAWALIAAGAAGLAGCATTGTAEGGAIVSAKERNARFTPATEAYSTLGYRHTWTGFPTMTAGARVSSLDVFEDVVTVVESGGVLSVLEAASGQTRWSDQLGNPLTKFLGVTRDDKQIICTTETDAYFLDIDTGTLVGKDRLLKVGNTPPEQVGNVLVYATAGGEIFGQVKLAGFRSWGHSMPGNISVRPGRMGNTLGFVSSTGDVLFLDGATGTGFGRAKMFMGTDVPPATSEELMFVASRDQSLYAFSAASSAPVWRYRTNVVLHDRPVYNAGVVYCSINGQGLTAFSEFGDGGRGNVLWTAAEVKGYVVGMRGGRLLVWDGSDACLLDPASGDLIERVALPGVTKVTTDGFVDGNLYMSTPEGLVIKLQPRL